MMLENNVLIITYNLLTTKNLLDRDQLCILPWLQAQVGIPIVLRAGVHSKVPEATVRAKHKMKSSSFSQCMNLKAHHFNKLFGALSNRVSIKLVNKQ